MLPLVGKTVLAAVQFHIQIRLLAKEIEIGKCQQDVGGEIYSR